MLPAAVVSHLPLRVNDGAFTNFDPVSSSVLSQKSLDKVFLMPGGFSQPRQGRNTVAQGESPGKNGPHPLLFPLPRWAGGGGRTQDPRLSPWAKLCRPLRGLTSLTNLGLRRLAGVKRTARPGGGFNWCEALAEPQGLRREVTPHPSRDGWKKRRRGTPSPQGRGLLAHLAALFFHLRPSVSSRRYGTCSAQGGEGRETAQAPCP